MIQPKKKSSKERRLGAASTVSMSLFRIYSSRLDGLDLEMQTDEWEYHTFKILYKVIEATETFDVAESESGC